MDEKKINYNKDWCKPYCADCPYFVNDETTKMRHCVRPFGESCLAEGLLVAPVIAAKNMQRLKAILDNEPKSNKLSTKKIKR